MHGDHDEQYRPRRHGHAMGMVYLVVEETLYRRLERFAPAMRIRRQSGSQSVEVVLHLFVGVVGETGGR